LQQQARAYAKEGVTQQVSRDSSYQKLEAMYKNLPFQGYLKPDKTTQPTCLLQYS